MGLDERITRYLRHVSTGRRLLPQAWGRAQASLAVATLLVISAAFVFSLSVVTRSATPGLAQGPLLLRPASDVTVGAWVSTPLWDKVDEVAPDDATTEITSESDPVSSTFEVKLSGVTDPQSFAGHIVRYRLSKTGTKATTADVSLYQGLTLIRAVCRDAQVFEWPCPA